MSEEAVDRSWAARATALRRELPANLALLAAVLAMLGALCGWLFVLLPLGSHPRGSPVFWLLAAPFLCWTTPLLAFRAWAVNTVGLALAAAPGLALAALLAAAHRHATAPLTVGPEALDSSGAMQVVLGVSLAFALAGLVALRRSSLPGGTRPPAYLTPGTLPAGLYPVPPAQRTALAIGSLTLSGVLVNGVFFTIVTLVDVRAATLGPLWPAAIPLVLTGVTIAFLMRGGRRLARRHARAAHDLRRGWCLGAGGASLMLALVWLWPTEVVLKGAMSLFMVPMAAAAVWGGYSAARRLREAERPPR